MRDSCFICVSGATFFIWCDSFFIWHDHFYLVRLFIWQLRLRLRPNSSHQIISVEIVIVGNLRSYDGNCNENVTFKLNFAVVNSFAIIPC